MKLLNYRIRYDLENFEASYINDSFRESSFISSTFYGTSFFEDLGETKNKHLKNRKIAYEGSIQHFFWSLINNKLFDFKIEENELMLNPRRYLNTELIDEENMFYKIELDSKFFEIVESTAPKHGLNEIYKSYPLRVVYKKDVLSIIEFRHEKVYLDSQGHYTPIDALVLYNAIAELKLGSMIPLNFVYQQN